MKRQYNITQTSLKMEKKIATANSFHETSITLITSPQKKKKRQCEKGKLLANLTDEIGVPHHYWQFEASNISKTIIMTAFLRVQFKLL